MPDYTKMFKEKQANARMQTPAAPAVEEEEFESIDLTAPLRPAPAVPTQEPAPAPQEEPKQKPPKQPKQPKLPKESTAPKSTSPKNKSRKEEEEDTADKEKYSIYLPPKLSLALRMVYICTRKKYSHIAETALNDMLFNRYQCDNPKCTARFSISEREDAPICCPVCGKNTFSPLRLDLLD